MATLNDFYPVAVVSTDGLSKNISSTVDFGRELNLSNTWIDFSDNTSGVPVAAVAPYYSLAYAYLDDAITPTAYDALTFDKRFCSIIDVEYYHTSTLQPLNKPLGEGGRSDWFTLEYCGRIHNNVNAITPTDNDGNITLTGITHGLPLNMEGGSMVVSSAGFAEAGIKPSLGDYTILSIDDATTLTLNVSLTDWNIQMARGLNQNMYFLGVVFPNGGGRNYSAGTLKVAWTFDRTHPDFQDALFSDG